MKAFQLVKYGTPSSSVFKEVDVEKPTLLKDNELLVKVHAFGLNYADVMARKGLYKAAPPLPCILGYEVIGEIVAVKNTKNNEWMGKRVLAMTRFGGYAEYAKTVINGVVEIPKEISNGAALALATQYCTAYFALCHEIKLYPGETVLIHAASGGVGTALTQLAKWKGCKVIGLTRSPKKVDYLTKNGVDLPIVTTETDYKSEVNNYPEYKKVSAAFNAVGGTTVKKDLSIYENTKMHNPAAYSVSKAGLLQLTRWMSTVLAPKIRVNSISPGGIFRNQPEEFVKRYIQKTPLKRMGSESDIVGAVIYLSGNLSSWVTGQNIIVDGGWGVW